MADIAQQIAEIENEIRKTPYHKGTQHHVGRMRAKIARLKDKEIETGNRKSGGGGGYAVKKQGDATIVLVGPPSAGKSTLINKLTNAESKVAAYAFTTVSVIPGMMKYKNAYIQILDVPGLIEGAQAGKGRGKEVLSVARNSDLIVFMTDPKRLDFFKKLVKELENAGIRINKQKPLVKINKKTNGGLAIQSNIKQDLDKETIKEIAEEFGVKNGEITINEKLTMDRLVDAFARNRVYIPAIYLVNKSDTLNKKADKNIDPRILRISAEEEIGLDDLRSFIWEKLQFVTLYLVKADEEPNNENSIIVKSNFTLQEVAEKIGPDFMEGKTSAKIWGNTAKFPGQEVSLKTKVQDGMQVRFI
jgi:small GTP-binding protein